MSWMTNRLPEEIIIGWKNMVEHRNNRIAKGEAVPVLDPWYLLPDKYQPRSCSTKKRSGY